MTAAPIELDVTPLHMLHQDRWIDSPQWIDCPFCTEIAVINVDIENDTMQVSMLPLVVLRMWGYPIYPLLMLELPREACDEAVLLQYAGLWAARPPTKETLELTVG
ncbi:hypothetical protein GCG54_00006839 [Colletotrichum gloeosporioides]|uniref:Uncharacterized protein n=1 Tax=Colletotrichum gloeosporioides TaxID=474922 RepID=A0A8H4FN98_COLGL|nr:uncharacterized protein GCG54_00006839 [Colletotrichum gloeosporioides]KAF3808221.1 hypothetical protein GCG54_00006839 [Colletotrichum gloeosporioides]